MTRFKLMFQIFLNTLVMTAIICAGLFAILSPATYKLFPIQGHYVMIAILVLMAVALMIVNGLMRRSIQRQMTEYWKKNKDKVDKTRW